MSICVYVVYVICILLIFIAIIVLAATSVTRDEFWIRTVDITRRHYCNFGESKEYQIHCQLCWMNTPNKMNRDTLKGIRITAALVSVFLVLTNIFCAFITKEY